MMRVYSLFIYLTGRCLLDCSYCYFRKRSKRDLAWPKLDRILSCLERDVSSPEKIVISGGEPFLCYPVLKRLVFEARRRFGQIPLSVQSNGLLLDDSKLAFLLSSRVSLEVGIDGGMKTTLLHRRGMTPEGYGRIVSAIRRAVRAGVPVSCTMTVHPDQVAGMEKNFLVLQSLGLCTIDITPAAFMPWNDLLAGEFRRQYQRILRSLVDKEEILLAEDRKIFAEPFFDLSIYPDGSVLCGDAFSCVPQRIKRSRSLVSAEGCRWNKDKAEAFRKEYALLWTRGRSCTYREYVRRSFEIADRMGDGFLDIKRLNEMMRSLSLDNLRSMVCCRSGAEKRFRNK